MLEVEQLKNIGPVVGAELRSVGILTRKDLLSIGLEEAFQRLCEQYPERLNLNCLTAMYGAINDCDWRKVPASKKEYLKKFLNNLKKMYGD